MSLRSSSVEPREQTEEMQKGRRRESCSIYNTLQWFPRTSGSDTRTRQRMYQRMKRAHSPKSHPRHTLPVAQTVVPFHLSFCFLPFGDLIAPLRNVRNLVPMMPAVGEKVYPPSVVTHSAIVAWPYDLPSISARALSAHCAPHVDRLQATATQQEDVGLSDIWME